MSSTFSRVAMLLAVTWLVLRPGPARATTTTEDPERPTLLQVATDGTRTELPLVRSHLSCEVRGPIAQVTLVQSFHNASTEAIEAVYVFPMHDRAAVGGMTMHVGTRTIHAVIKTREQARTLYDEAKQDGKTAALLEQERPNVFTQSVANILPGEQIDIELIYDVLLEPDAGEYELALPTVVGPRYIPGTPTAAAPTGGGIARDTDQVPDASRISPPIAPPGESTGNDYGLDLDLDVGMPITEITSPTHAIAVTPHDDNHFAVTLAHGDAPADKDLVIRWRVVVDQPTIAMLADRSDGRGHLAFVLQPPPPEPAAAREQREMVFVLDTSGSMDGEPLALVKRGVRRALEDLGPDDVFRIINFSTDVGGFKDGAVLAASPANLRDARSWLNGVVSEGGTEMLEGIRAALPGTPAGGRTRYVVFMTDGYIGNDDEILAEVAKLRDKHTHLFSFGVGSSVNRSLLDKMADVGDGVVDYMLLDEDPAGQLDDFFSRVGLPAMTEIKIDWGGLGVDNPTPAHFGTLYAGRPIVVAAHYTRGGTGTIEVTGVRDGKPVKLDLAVTLPDAAGDGPVLGRLWARRRLGDLLLAGGLGEQADPAVATKLALDYSLMSPYTSFVAIDERRRVDAPATTIQVPVDLPEGVSAQAVQTYGANYGGEVISISGNAPIIDQGSTTQGVTIDRDYAANIPLPGRTFGAVAGSAFAGSSSLENQYYVDGINTTYIDDRPLPRWRLSLSAAGGYDHDGGRALGGFSSSIERRFGDSPLALGATGTWWRLDDERSLLSVLATISRWSLLRVFDLRLGLGVGSLERQTGVSWQVRLAAPLPVGGMFQPELDLGIDGATLEDDSVLSTSIGVGLRF